MACVRLFVDLMASANPFVCRASTEIFGTIAKIGSSKVSGQLVQLAGKKVRSRCEWHSFLFRMPKVRRCNCCKGLVIIELIKNVMFLSLLRVGTTACLMQNPPYFFDTSTCGFASENCGKLTFQSDSAPSKQTWWVLHATPWTCVLPFGILLDC